MGVFSCSGNCSTAAALRAEVEHLRELVNKLVVSRSPEAAAALIAYEQQQQPPAAAAPQQKPVVFQRPTSHHPRMLAQLAELEQSGPKR
jgi:hypothetical protein